MSYVVWRAVEVDGITPIEGALVHGVGLQDEGEWISAPTNRCGEVGTSLGPGQYDVTFSKLGYENAGYYPATIGVDGGPISKALPRSIVTPAWSSPRGAFCIPQASSHLPFNRVWDPAWGTYSTFQQDAAMAAHQIRGHNTIEYQLSGFPYHTDYPELDTDPARCRRDLLRIKDVPGMQTMVAFDDRRWPDLSYLQPMADATQDCVDCVMGIYEVNGVVKDAGVVLDLLVQARRLWPAAKLAVHFTDLMQGESHGLVNFTDAVNQANLNMLLFQGGFWLSNPATLQPWTDDECAARIADFTRRLGGPGMGGANWHTLSDGVVGFEGFTSLTYRDQMSEADNNRRWASILSKVGGKPDGTFVSVPCTGFMDGCDA